MVIIIGNYNIFAKNNEDKIEFVFGRIVEDFGRVQRIDHIAKSQDLSGLIDYALDYVLSENQVGNSFSAAEIREAIEIFGNTKKLWKEREDFLLHTFEGQLFLRNNLFPELNNELIR